MFAAFAYQQWTALAIDFAQLFYFCVRTSMRFLSRKDCNRLRKRLMDDNHNQNRTGSETTTETEPLHFRPTAPDPKKNLAKTCALRHRLAV